MHIRVVFKKYQRKNEEEKRKRVAAETAAEELEKSNALLAYQTMSTSFPSTISMFAPATPHSAAEGAGAGAETAAADADTEGVEERKDMCPIHKTCPLLFYCTDDACKTTICAMCAAEGHKLHAYIKLADASGAEWDEVAAVVTLAVGALTEVSDGIVAVNERRKEVKKSKEETLAEVQQAYKMVQAGIIVQLKDVQEDTVEEGERKDGVLANQNDALEIAKERLECGLELANRMEEGASVVEKLQIKRLLVDGLKAAMHHNVCLQPICGPSVTFDKTDQLIALMAKIPMLSSISGGDANPAACTADGKGTAAASRGVAAEFVVTAVDFDGQQKTAGGDGIALVVTFQGTGGKGDGGEGGGAAGSGEGGGATDGSTEVVTSAADQKDGTYSCSYTVPKGSPEGEYHLGVLIFGQHIQGSPFAVQVSGHACVHTSAFDTNGALYWIGTGGGSKDYENPHGKSGGVVAKMSSETNGSPEKFVENANRNADNYITAGDPWMSVDLGEGRRLAADYYCLRTDSNGSYACRNWKLEASNDSTTWTTLSTHSDDRKLRTNGCSTASWPIEATAVNGNSYRHFRVRVTGRCAEGSSYLMCSGIELYGLLEGV